MTFDELKPDQALTLSQLAIVEKLTPNQLVTIDEALLPNCNRRWRKVAAVVGFTMTDEFMAAFVGVPDVYCAQRVRELVESGRLESVGDLNRMRYSEVRLPQGRDE